jgi:ribosome-associated toxin RatA of RatAB toxin-antitoxin module
MHATIVVSAAGMRQSLTTRNQLTPAAHIEMQLEQGPFSALSGGWSFVATEDNQCLITLQLSFEISNPLMARMIGPFFEQVMRQMMEAFCQRAEVLYAQRDGGV